MRRWAFLPALAAWAPSAAAHDAGPAGAPPQWTWDPWIVVPLALALILFASGWLRLRARSARATSRLDRQAWLFGLGWLVLAGAVLSPLHELGERSFAAHMFEHELLMLVAAPLLVLAHPLPTMLWAFPAAARRGIGAAVRFAPVAATTRAFTAPIPATLLQAAALWLWHAPALFDRALGSDAWHASQHLCFLVTGLLFWSAMFAQATPRGVAVLCLFATSLVSGALGALMAFALSPWYARYAGLRMAPLGLSPIEDQQLAGMLMWVPGGLVHAGAAFVLVHALMRDAEVAPEVPHAR